MPGYVVGSLAILTSLLALAAVVGRALLPAGARRAFENGDTRLLKGACLGSQLLWWAGLVCALAWIFTLVSLHLDDRLFEFFASGILLAVPVTLAMTRWDQFRNDHWDLIHQALAARTPTTDAQRQTWMEYHGFLLRGSQAQRDDTLRKILSRAGPTRIYVTTGQRQSSQETRLETASEHDVAAEVGVPATETPPTTNSTNDVPPKRP